MDRPLLPAVITKLRISISNAYRSTYLNTPIAHRLRHTQHARNDIIIKTRSLTQGQRRIHKGQYRVTRHQRTHQTLSVNEHRRRNPTRLTRHLRKYNNHPVNRNSTARTINSRSRQHTINDGNFNRHHRPIFAPENRPVNLLSPYTIQRAILPINLPVVI